ncbi:MAG TPA: allantoate amidohydrolase [Vicinamibacterales bacterium]|jgi:allantoate deiminase|nr:allantoate amidohydrolase [Vicinamibacterales bacterium]
MYEAIARQVISRCRFLATCSDEPGYTTRTFLSPSMRTVHAEVARWMTDAGMRVHVDAAGNIRGVHAGAPDAARRLYIGSHLDTVPRAGAFDGVLGVVMGVALVESLRGRRLPFDVEIVGFSEEEGVRFGIPFIGSRAVAGDVDAALLAATDASGTSIAQAIGDFGLDVSRIADARAAANPLGYLEFHIEQGPVLEALARPIAVVDRIVGRTYADVTFAGSAGHAGTTPMDARRDALTGAAEWIGCVETQARRVQGLVATTGRIDATPGAANVIAGSCRVTLDVRHADDAARTMTVGRLQSAADDIAARRGLTVEWSPRFEHEAVAMHPALVATLARAVERAGVTPHVMPSGAGHDAMILAPHMPVAMLFIRTPRGLSHHPDEIVMEGDVAVALAAGAHFLEELGESDVDD